MLNNIIKRYTQYLSVSGIISEEKREIYAYGLELIIYSFINIFVLLMMSAVFKCFIYGLLLLLSFIPLQTYGGGFHAYTHLRCFTVMLFGWGVAAYVTSNIFVPNYVILFVSVVSIAVIFKFAPIINPNSPMSRAKFIKMGHIARLIACINITLIWTLSFTGKNDIALIICFGLFFSALSMLAAKMSGRCIDPF